VGVAEVFRDSAHTECNCFFVFLLKFYKSECLYGMAMPAEKQQGTILVVDDDKHNVELLDVILKHAGYKVITATSGEDALEIIKHDPIDVALLDVMMPGMSGTELCGRLKKNPATEHVPVILISAQMIQDEDVVSGIDYGADEYLIKPIDTAILMARVKSWLRIKNYEDKLRDAYLILSEHNNEIQRLNKELGQRNSDMKAVSEKIDQELKLAREVQAGLLPASYPECPHLDFHVICEASGMVGGDYYDFVKLVDDSIGILVADAAGRGLPAAFIATMTKMAFENYAFMCLKPSQLAEKLNARLLPMMTGGRYVTGFYGVYRPDLRELTFVRAGHPKPILVHSSSGSIEELDSRGRPMGILAEGDYHDNTIGLKPGDKIVVYTDGAIECRNPALERFGLVRLHQVIRAYAQKSVKEIVCEIYESLKTFCGSEALRDDVTLLGFEITQAAADVGSDGEY